MKKLFFLLQISISYSLLTSCSLFNVDLNTGVEPLPAKELNTRILMHDYANKFSYAVESLADSMMELTADKEIRMNALLWKINASAMSRQAIFQPVPYASLVDTWTFCRQQYHFFSKGEGKTYLGEFQPDVIRVTNDLDKRMELIARTVSTAREFKTYVKFVDDYAQEHPFENIYFNRGSLLTEINHALSLPDSAAINTIGNMPEAISELSSKMNNFTTQMPKITRWRTQAYLYEAGVDSVDIKAVMDSITLLTSRISYITENSPELLDSAIIKLNKELAPLVNKLDKRWSETLWKLGEERLALMESLDLQRMELSETVTTEREVIMEDLNVLSKELVEQSWIHIKELIYRSLFLILLILIVMLGLPFGLGYLTGRTLKIKKHRTT